MAIKTFTAGSVLTASDTNTYLANAGLVYVTSTTFSAVTSVSVNSCFTSTYRNYRLLVDFTASSAGTSQLQFRLRKSGTDAATAYYYGNAYSTYGGTGGNFGGTNVTYVYVVNKATGYPLYLEMDIHSPQVSTSGTPFNLRSISNDSTSWVGGGYHATADAYDGFSLISDSGTITGDLYVYGYRKA